MCDSPRSFVIQVGPGMYQQYAQQECDECDNVKYEREALPISVEIDPGTADGGRLSFFEEGEPMIDGEPGDLIFVVKQVHCHKMISYIFFSLFRSFVFQVPYDSAG